MHVDKRALYLCRPEPNEEGDVDVVDVFPKFHVIFEIAAELWRLVGNDALSREISAVTLRGYERTPTGLLPDDIAWLMAALDGIERAVVGAVTGPDLLIPLDRIAELRTRSKYLWLDEVRGELARHAVEEALYDVEGLRYVLRQAIEGGTGDSLRVTVYGPRSR